MKKRWVLYAVAAIVLYLIGNTLYVAGAFKSIEGKSAGQITVAYTGIYGPEDMDLDERRAILYVSSTNRRKVLNGLPSSDGIWALDVDSTSLLRKLATDYKGEFHPHGISFLRTGSEEWLFAVNHNSSGNFIEIFLIANDSLLHRKSVQEGALLCCPNDVVAVAPDKFYVTNDHGTMRGIMRTIEDYGRLPYSTVLYYDGSTFTTVAEGLRYGNGINVNSDGTRLYVAATTGRNLLTFERDTITGLLTQLGELALGTGLDNIDVDADGNLWIAAHPKLLDFVAHAKDSTRQSPSQVLRLSPNPDNTYRVQEVFMDDGSILSGSSVAVRYKDQLFIGGVFQPTVLRIALDEK